MALKKLVDKNGVEHKVGDWVQSFNGLGSQIIAIYPPEYGGSSGKIKVEGGDLPNARTFFVTVFGLKFVEVKE